MTVPSTSQAPTSASIWKNPRNRFDLRTFCGAGLAVLIMRVVFGILAIPITLIFPHTELEARIGLSPSGASIGEWLYRWLISPWIRYDAWNYLRIVDHGYSLSEGTASFHPLYPILVWPFALVFQNIPVALLFVSSIATIIATMLLTRYVERFYRADYAQPVGWLLLMNPLGFILLSPYTESTFLCFAIAALWAIRLERWWLAGLLGAGAVLTRQQGVALALPMAWAIWLAWRDRRTAWWQAGSLALLPGAYLLFVVYRAIALGDAISWSESESLYAFLSSLLVSSSAEQVVVGQRIAWPWEPLIGEIQRFMLAESKYPFVIDTVIGWAAVLVLMRGWRLLRMQDLLYSIAIALLSLCYYNGDLSPYLAFPRHMLLAFPIFVILVSWAGSLQRQRLLIEILFMVNIFLVGAFIRHGWVP